MYLKIGQHIRCLLTSGLTVEGIIKDYSDNLLLLSSVTDNSEFIIHNCDKSLLLTSIINQTTEEKIVEKPIQTEFEKSFEINLEEEGNEDDEEISEASLKSKTLAKLHLMMAEQEKKNIKEKLKNHSIGDVQPIQYKPINLATIKVKK